MDRQTRYPKEVRERAVHLVLEHEREYNSQWAAITSIAAKLGMTPETLRKWIRRAETDQGLRPGLTSSERERMRQLEKENRELRRANEILKAAAVGSTGRCNTEYGRVSIGRWVDGAVGPAGLDGRTEAGALVAVASGRIAERDRTRARQAGGIDPRGGSRQRRLCPGEATPLTACALARRAGGDLSRTRRRRLAADDRETSAKGVKGTKTPIRHAATG